MAIPSAIRGMGRPFLYTVLSTPISAWSFNTDPIRSVTLSLPILLYFVLICERYYGYKRYVCIYCFKIVSSYSLALSFHFCVQLFFTTASYSFTENVESWNLNSSVISRLCEIFGNVAFNDAITIRSECCHDWVKKKSIQEKEHKHIFRLITITHKYWTVLK